MAMRCGGGVGAVCTNRLSSDQSSSSELTARLPSLVRTPIKKLRPGWTMSATREVSGVGSQEATRRNRSKIDHEKMDAWMPVAVVEIVKNLKRAPLLVQVYESGDKDGTGRLKTDMAVAEEWPVVKESWGVEGAPEGVMLVEELGEEDDEASDKAWGILIQGRGCECGPACYLLKTSRVRSGAGTACTHFCLTKVTSYRETALSQLTNCWLLE